MPQPLVPPSGVWCPAVTLFDEEDDLVLKDQASYFSYLARSGLAGLLVLGTNAETFLLTREERRDLVKTAREAVGPDFPLMAGVGGHSTKQVIQHMHEAADAGADYALVLPPAYFGAKLTTAAVLRDFFEDVASVAEMRGLGVVVYNFPGVCNGVDLDSTAVAALARRHPGRVTGVKLTCGSVAKITRLAAELPAEEFAVFGGQSDFLLGGLAVGSAGCIAAFANVFPKTVVRVYTLWKEGRGAEALALHRRAALAEQAVKSGGIAAVKYAASVFTAPRAGVKGAEGLMKPRRPYLELGEAEKRAIREALAGVAEIENSL
ncbi:dihydrodipicolinate synthetase [Lasiosphaeria hispida]|uniref:Dihydrodipicolinate synthetase n=1 Tax=Lasiosphaeria hispida TaxID=260671 RepID=A0AAJ0MDB0_9PEZI|nr:dihydrodipicolinate synthetase [Lasiosphaeria hispida]